MLALLALLSYRVPPLVGARSASSMSRKTSATTRRSSRAFDNRSLPPLHCAESSPPPLSSSSSSSGAAGCEKCAAPGTPVAEQEQAAPSVRVEQRKKRQRQSVLLRVHQPGPEKTGTTEVASLLRLMRRNEGSRLGRNVTWASRGVTAGLQLIDRCACDPTVAFVMSVRGLLSMLVSRMAYRLVLRTTADVIVHEQGRGANPRSPPGAPPRLSHGEHVLLAGGGAPLWGARTGGMLAPPTAAAAAAAAARDGGGGGGGGGGTTALSPAGSRSCCWRLAPRDVIEAWAACRDAYHLRVARPLRAAAPTGSGSST